MAAMLLTSAQPRGVLTCAVVADILLCLPLSFNNMKKVSVCESGRCESDSKKFCTPSEMGGGARDAWVTSRQQSCVHKHARHHLAVNVVSMRYVSDTRPPLPFDAWSI